MTPDDNHHLAMAKITANRSKAVRLKVGAVLVEEGGGVMSFGYNGTPKGESNVCEYEVDGELVTKPDVIHAEMNALYKFLDAGLSARGATMYLTHSPCLECSKGMFLAHVKRVVYLEDYRSDAGVDFLRGRGIEVTKAT